MSTIRKKKLEKKITRRKIAKKDGTGIKGRRKSRNKNMIAFKEMICLVGR